MLDRSSSPRRPASDPRPRLLVFLLLLIPILNLPAQARAGEWDNDPVPALTDEEVAAYSDAFSEEKANALLAAYVDRIEETYTGRHKPPEGLLPWLAANPDLRRDFWLALHPSRDDIGAAMGILDALRKEDAEKAAEFPHLSVALAVVWDAPQSVRMSQKICIFAVKPEQFPEPMGYLKTFRYFTDDTRAKSFYFKMEDLVWPLMVYLVNFDVSEEEADWALAKFGKQNKNVGSTYAMVQYDDGKRDTGGSSTKLGSNPYTLPNILKYGGVCGDQAHFCSRVAKCLGIPAMKASGLSRYGGAGHAFACYFVLKKNRPILESTGRYYYDFYYTGNIYDPQTCERVLDRTVAMMLDGATLSYDKYALSMAFTRIATKVYADHPETSLELTKKAITSNYFCAHAWRLMMSHVKDGHLPPAEGLKWANTMLRYLGDHPDLTHECFGVFLDCMDREEVKKRQAFYNRVAKVYEERPDLLLLLKVAQGKELTDAGRDGEALGVYLQTLSENGKEGRLLFPILEPAVKIVEENKKTMLMRSLPFFEKMIKKFPQRRGGSMSKSFQEASKMVLPLFEAGGDKKMAARIKRWAGL